jgi:hypothetical protein
LVRVNHIIISSIITELKKFIHLFVSYHKCYKYILCVYVCVWIQPLHCQTTIFHLCLVCYWCKWLILLNQSQNTITIPLRNRTFPDSYCCNCLDERRREGRPRSLCHIILCCEQALFLHECLFDVTFHFVSNGW